MRNQTQGAVKGLAPAGLTKALTHDMEVEDSAGHKRFIQNTSLYVHVLIRFNVSISIT